MSPPTPLLESDGLRLWKQFGEFYDKEIDAQERRVQVMGAAEGEADAEIAARFRGEYFDTVGELWHRALGYGPDLWEYIRRNPGDAGLLRSLRACYEDPRASPFLRAMAILLDADRDPRELRAIVERETAECAFLGMAAVMQHLLRTESGPVRTEDVWVTLAAYEADDLGKLGWVSDQAFMFSSGRIGGAESGTISIMLREIDRARRNGHAIGWESVLREILRGDDTVLRPASGTMLMVLLYNMTARPMTGIKANPSQRDPTLAVLQQIVEDERRGGIRMGALSYYLQAADRAESREYLAERLRDAPDTPMLLTYVSEREPDLLLTSEGWAAVNESFEEQLSQRRFHAARGYMYMLEVNPLETWRGWFEERVLAHSEPQVRAYGLAGLQMRTSPESAAFMADVGLKAILDAAPEVQWSAASLLAALSARRYADLSPDTREAIDRVLESYVPMVEGWDGSSSRGEWEFSALSAIRSEYLPARASRAPEGGDR